MLLTFLENIKYSEDAHTVRQGHEGETRDVAHSTACYLLRNGSVCNAEEPTGNNEVDKIMDDIISITCKKQSADEELYNCIDALNKLLRPQGASTIQKVPNQHMNGFNAGHEVRNLDGDDIEA